MEDYSQQEANDQDGTTSRRSFMKGEFLKDWLNRPQTPEKPAAGKQTEERPATRLGEFAYLAHDKEPPPKEIEAPDNLAVGSTARFGSELQRQRRQETLRQQLNVAPDLETERQEVIERQAAFGQELPEHDSKLSDTTLQKLEADRQQLHSRLEAEPNALGEESLKQLANTSPEAKPDEIFVSSQEAADRNIPIEGMRELRHERKDEADDVTSTTASGNYQPSGSLEVPPPPFEDAPETHTTESGTGPQTSSPAPKSVRTDLYRQAVVAGFWTALILAIIGMILLILSR